VAQRAVGSFSTWAQVHRDTRHPASWRRCSRRRSRSKAELVSWKRRPSASTINPASRQRKSTSRRPPPTSSAALTSGRGKPARTHIRRNRRSSSLRVLLVAGSSSSRMSRSRATPRRPRLRRINLRRSAWSRICRTSASATALLSAHTGPEPAKSRSVRATVVQGMPCTRVRSPATIEPSLWAITPSGIRPRRLHAVTSIAPSSWACSPHSAAADPWDKSASGPQASTAAIHFPSTASRARPTA
jgi:hypothetical protein